MRMPVLFYLLTALSGSLASAAPRIHALEISVLDPGVYAVAYEKLAAAGLAGPVPSARLSLTQNGRPVALWVEDRGDGTFGPGDHLEFVGERLAGESTYFNPWTDRNVYVLSWQGGGAPLRLRAAAGAATAPGASPLLARQHLEQDLLLLRFPGPEEETADSWYWTRLTQADAAPFRQPIDLAGLDRGSAEPVRVTLHLRGWSKLFEKPDPQLPDHAATLTVGGREVARTSWEGNGEDHALEATLPAASLANGKIELSLAIPRRGAAGRTAATDAMIDVVVLNWIEVTYPRRPAIDSAQMLVERPATAGELPVRVPISPGARLTAYTANGARVDGAGTELTVPAAVAGASLWIVRNGELKAPFALEADLLSHWASPDHQADYIVITHPSLAAELGPLVDLHRKEGMSVAVVDVRDVYDEWSHGLVHPRALRDFLSYAYFHWQKPRPRFVLLVGDASWDGRTRPGDATYADAAYVPAHGTQIAVIDSTPYPAEERQRSRNLIPTWRYGTFDGHAAGDNWFVTVEGKDTLPDMAIGRFPVTEPEEVRAIVDKTVRYARAAARATDSAPGHRDVLWITNEEAHFQQWSDELAGWIATRGLSSEKLFPSPGGKSAEEQQELLESLNRGPLVVHFMGHGGRFIWRTGPPDWTKHRDLFTLEDVDKLTPADRLPVILSMTCYSAPFDHPTADSIGEKFLRAPGRGAVAVIAASWRNAPYKTTSEILLRELTEPGATLGEALAKAKAQVRDTEFVKQYNLLGDPALKLAMPPKTALTAAPADAAAPNAGAPTAPH
jgi:hypothetical protein